MSFISQKVDRLRTTFASPPEQTLAYIGRKTGYSTFVKNAIITTNLIMQHDATNSSSYPGTGTTWTNLISGSYNATLTGPTYSSDSGGLLSFDGTNDYAEISSLTISSSFSIELIVKVDDLSSIKVIAGKHGGGQDFWVGRDSSRFKFSISMPITKYEPISSVISTNTWYHLVAVYNSTNLTAQIYLNGTLEDTKTGTAAISNPTGNYFLGNFISQYHFAGDIATHLFYDKALTGLEVLQNYEMFSRKAMNTSA